MVANENKCIILVLINSGICCTYGNVKCAFACGYLDRCAEASRMCIWISVYNFNEWPLSNATA